MLHDQPVMNGTGQAARVRMLVLCLIVVPIDLTKGDFLMTWLTYVITR